MRTIAIFGGTFEPFTVAHRNIVEQVLDHDLADHVLIVPSIVNYYREGKEPLLKPEEKLFVINRLLEGIRNRGHVNIDEYEFEMLACIPGNKEAFQKRHRFIDTLVRIRHQYKDVNLKFIIGTDEYKNFKNWTMWDTILSMATPIIVDGRNGENIINDLEIAKLCAAYKEDFGCNVIQIDPKYANVSASAVRENLKNGLGLEEYCNSALGCSTLLTTPIFTVKKVKLLNSEFEPIQVEAPDWVTVIARKNTEDTNEEVFVTVAQLRYGRLKEYLEFPCGTVEKGENPTQAAVRAMRDKTGINIQCPNEDMIYLGKAAVNPEFMTNFMHYFFINLNTARTTACLLKPGEPRHGRLIDYPIRVLMRAPCDSVSRRSEDLLPVPALTYTGLFLYNHFVKNPENHKKVEEYDELRISNLQV